MDEQRKEKIRKRLEWQEPDPDVGDSQKQLSIAILGHSFVARLIEILEPSVTLRQGLLLENTHLYPSLIGISGGKFTDLPQLVIEAQEVNPHMVIVDMGTNDLCSPCFAPIELAETLKDYADDMFVKLQRLELVVLCQVTCKTKIKRSTKSLEVFNVDTEKFNIELLRITRNNHRILRWRHQGMFRGLLDHTIDGTHPDSERGKTKYIRSISQACEWGEEKLLERRSMTKNAIKRRDKKVRVQKRKEYEEAKKMKALPEGHVRTGRDRRFPRLKV